MSVRPILLEKIGVLLVTLFVVSNAFARPEIFVGAMQFGAKDCTFCHATVTGGEALNERGAWLVQERIRLGVEEVDVNWLKSREDVVEQQVAEEVAEEDPISSNTDEKVVITRERDEERPFDFTTDFGEWPAYGGDIGAKKYSPLNQITRENLDDLEIAWVWESTIDAGVTSRREGSRAGDMFKGTPLMVDGRVFIRTRYSSVAAIDAVTGETLWTYDPGTKDGPRPAMFGFTTRGLAFHKDEEGGRVLLVTSRGWLIALDAATGAPIKEFGSDGKVDLRKGLRRPLNPRYISWSHAPNVCGDVVVIGSQPDDNSHARGREFDPWHENIPLGDVRGFDVRTGEQRWVFKTVPQEGEFGNETWGKESWKWMGNTNVWSTTSCDAEKKIVYLPVTAPTHHFYGGDRPGNNLFGTSLVAVHADTGERVWHFQNVHHDIWDYDNPAAPVVADVVQNGKTRKIVAQVTKIGYLFVFDRLTGEPIWEIEEVEVPGSDLEGEQPSPTQPRPTWPPPFEMQGIDEESIIDLSPEINKRAKQALAKWKYGPMYSTPSLRGTLILPGIGGGANWGGAAFDPNSRMLYVAHSRMPTLINIFRAGEDETGIRYQGWFTMPNMQGIPFLKPPWSSITAYNLDTGAIVWTRPNGTGPKNHALLRGLDLPDLGDLYQQPGLLVTPSAIFHGSNAQGSVLKALDKSNGDILWTQNIPGTFAMPPPITYMAEGKQYIVIGTGGSWEPARLVAFRLHMDP